ncbi:MAG: hypothetical protein IJR09_06255 [Paludibacteraceae bacterium]|nr:hypothetical protein [Paludibacteraceae bacterium]MBQ6749019.1 hypothetical protein [Paludibacteraceae bacterium]MBR0064960.1 hypothetical protein [Paludibacteraceae bacterium]
MKRYMIPATDIVAIKTKLCQSISTNSGYGDQNGPQFAPARGEIIG